MASTLDYSSRPGDPGKNSGLREFLESNQRLATLLGAAVIVVVVLVAYSPAMRGGFIWDDDNYVTKNPFLLSWDGLQRIWFDVISDPAAYALRQYYPMTHTSFWLEYRLWGLNPTGYHIVNIVLHICNALLIWLLLRKLHVPGSWLAATIFALHPINVESVAWISERKNVLSMLFFLSSLYVYLRYTGIIEGAPPKPAKVREESAEDDVDPLQDIEWFTLPNDPNRLYALALVLFLAAIFSKTVTYSLPAVVLLLTWWKRGRLSSKDFLPLLPFFAIGIAMASLTAYLERYNVGVAYRSRFWDFSPTAIGEFGARLIIAGKAIWFYVTKLLVPYPLLFNYERWTIDPSRIIAYGFPIAVLLVLGAIIAFRKRLGGNAMVVAVLYFLGTLFPALGFVDVWPMQYSFVADHFVYLSCIGLIALISAVVVRYLPIELTATLASILIVSLAGLSFMQSRIYRDPRTLWHTTWVNSDKQSWMAANNYGSQVFEDDLFAAEKWFEAAVRLKPDYSDARLNLARVAGRRAAAVDAMQSRMPATTQSATEVIPSSTTTAPSIAIATTQSAPFYQRAIEITRRLVEDDPMYFNARVFLSTLLLATGESDAARQELQRVIEVYPRHYDARVTLGQIALKEQRLDAAIEFFRQAAELKPDEPQIYALLGTALLQKGEAILGLQQWESAMSLDPKNWRLPNDFGVQMASSGKYPQAVYYFQQALLRNPLSVEVMTNLGLVAAKTGRLDDARRLFNDVLKMDPTYTRAKESLEAVNAGKYPATTQSTTRAATTGRS